MTRLTTASYTKIIFIVLIGVLLLGSLGFCSVRGCVSDGIPFGSETNMGSANVDASSIKNMTIKWAAGEVDVTVVDSTENNAIQLVESATGGFGRAQQMRWSVSGDTLNIDYGNWFSCLMSGSKRLEVRIPRAYADALSTVRIDGASGDYRVQDIGCKDLDLQLASGQLDVTNVGASSLSLDVASGNARIAGQFADSIDIRAASGEISVACEQVCPNKVDADVASGRITVALPENDGFTVKVDKASGSFSSAFPVSQEGNASVYGNGNASINVHLASGEFVIDKSGR